MGPLIAFFFITFAITEACFIGVARLPVGSVLRTPLLYLGTFMPAIVAIGLTRLREGADGLRDLFGRLTRGPVAARWWVFALLFMLAIKFGGALILRLTTGAWPRFDFSELALIPFAIAISSAGQAGEELGWRGYALPRMAARMGLGPASLVLGALWALWHLPLFYVRGADTFQQSFPVYAASVIAISVTIAWVYVRANGNLYVVMLLHSAINNTKDLVPSIATEPPGVFSIRASPMGVITMALLWGFAIYALVAMRGANLEPLLARRESPPVAP